MRGPLSGIESAFLAARDARDAADVARTRGVPAGEALARLEAVADEREAALLEALDAAPDPTQLTADDVAALDAMRRSIAAGLGLEDARPESADDPTGGAALAAALRRAFGAAADALTLDGAPIARLSILGRLGLEPDPERRRALFMALEPLWQAVDGDGRDASPYRDLLAAARPSADARLAETAAAVGIEPAGIETWCVAVLGAWRDATAATSSAPIEPWDWWWTADEADRLVGQNLPVGRLLEVTKAYVAALGADLHALGVGFDIVPRPDRPSIPVAGTTFGSRPRELADGQWTRGRPWVFATYREGGLGELTELIHEAGHALHVAGVQARPAYADWPDSGMFIEALAEVVALDTAEPAWLGRWVDPGLGSLDPAVTLRSRYADVALDTAWALFEIRAMASSDTRPNEVWTKITSEFLNIAPHPEWSWWAIRGQLAGSPGYMANYAVGAVLAADLRAAIRDDRGEWLTGDPGWYPWVRERIYRYGASRPARDVIRDVLGRPPSLAALLAELGRTVSRRERRRTRPA